MSEDTSAHLLIYLDCLLFERVVYACVLMVCVYIWKHVSMFLFESSNMVFIEVNLTDERLTWTRNFEGIEMEVLAE